MLETYPAGGAKNFIHGIDYQKLWLMLFFRRAVNRKYFFRLATEMSSAAGFDDIVFLDEQNGTTVCMLIQVKHKQDDSKKICVGDLLTKSGELNLVKHFAAFLEIRGNEEFKDKIKDFFIVINVDFDYESLASKGITVEKIETQDEFLNIGDSAKYKLRDLHNNIAQYLEQGMSAGGREVSDEEIRGFLNELVFVVNLPNDVELEKLIRNEINDDLARRFKYFGNNGYVFNALFTMMSSWMKNKRGRFLTPEEGEKFFREVEKLPSTLSEMRESLDKISSSVKITEKTTKDILEQLRAHGKPPNNKQRPRKKPYASRDKKSKAKEEGNIGELDEFDEIEALEFVKRALNIENNLQNKEIKKLAQELEYSQLALKLAVTYINEENIVFSRRGRKGIRVGSYLKKCKKIAEKLLDFKPEYKSDRFAKATFIAWKITIDAIMQKKIGPEALSILEMMAYFAPDEIYIEDIFSKQMANDKEALWNPVELLDRYSMIDLKGGVANIYRLVQKVTRLKLQEKGREEEVLRKALELINSYDVLIDNSIVASVWGYVSKYGELIDEFYFNPIYGRWKYTPLHSLAENGSYEAVRCILTHMEEKHPDKFNCVVNARDGSDSTPLYSAVASRELDIVQYLINKGADVNAESKNGITPLHQATYDGRDGIVEYLIGEGADVNAKDKSGTLRYTGLL